MEEIEYIESGILEMYVYGTSTESENQQVREMCERYPAVREEIKSIEQAVMSLSYSMSPPISVGVYERIRTQVLQKTETKTERRGANWTAIFGWAAAIALLLGIGYLYSELNVANNRVYSAETEHAKMKEDLTKLSAKNAQSESLLTVVRNANNTVVHLSGQTAAPHANAKVYWNPDTQQVYVDATGLPTPPQGMEYQVWSMTLTPTLTPVSLGLLKDFKGNAEKIFEVNGTAAAEAFGITLEPAGGSESPTLDQLYTMGKS